MKNKEQKYYLVESIKIDCQCHWKCWQLCVLWEGSILNLKISLINVSHLANQLLYCVINYVYYHIFNGCVYMNIWMMVWNLITDNK